MHLFQLHSFKERFYFSYFSCVEKKQGTVFPSEKFHVESFGDTWGSQGLGKVQKGGSNQAIFNPPSFQQKVFQNGSELLGQQQCGIQQKLLLAHLLEWSLISWNSNEPPADFLTLPF